MILGRDQAAGMAALPEPKKAKGGAPAGGSEEDEYAALVADFIKKNGPTSMAMVGKKVPKGNNVPKLGVFFKRRSEFVVDAKGKITLPGSEEDKYAARVADFIKRNGPTSIAIVGSKVPKGNNLPKLGAFIKSRSEFKYSEGIISLKK